MMFENSGPTSLNYRTSETQIGSLGDFPSLPFIGREVRLLQLHEQYFQPFYNLAERCDFEGSRDVWLSARCWQHPRSHSTLILVSGRNESHAKYAEVAYDFFTRGFDVWVYDHRGQGFSQRELLDTQIGWVDNFQNYVNDLSIFYSRIVAPRRTKNLYVLAHSMGAAVSSLWLTQTRIHTNAVMFTAPMIELVLKPYPRALVSLMVAVGLRSGRDQLYIPGGTEFKAAGYGFDLTNSSARRDWNRKLFTTHPEIRLGSPSYQWLHEALQVPRRLRAAGFPGALSCPLLVWQAGADQVVKPNAHRYLRHSGEKCVLMIERRSQHELLQERDEIRARVLAQTLSFFEATLSRGEHS